MNLRLEYYHNFIDNLVKLKKGVLGYWVTDRGFPDMPENKAINEFLDRMTPEDKKIIAALVEDGRSGGIHDTMAYLHDEINLKNLTIAKNGIELANEPYGTTMYWDWVARCEGDEWPAGDLDDLYK